MAMTGLDKITKKILAEAEKEAERILEEAKEEGLQQKAEEVARNALAMNFSVEQASKISGLSTDQIKALKTTSSALA